MAKPRAKKPAASSRVTEQQFELVDLQDLRPHPKNPNQGDIGEIFSSIEENGFYGTIVAQRSTGFIIAGNHRYLAAREAKLAQVPVAWIDVDDERAMRIMLADNRVAELAVRDDLQLSEILASLANTTGLQGTGYDGDYLDELVAQLAGPLDLSKAWEGMPEFEQNAALPFRSIVVHFQTPEAVVDFIKRMEQDVGAKAKFIYHPKQDRERLVGMQYEESENEEDDADVA